MSNSDNADSLERQLKDYKMLFRTADFPIVMLDSQGGFIDCTDSYLRFCGFEERSEMVNYHPGNHSPEFQTDGSNSFERAQLEIQRAIENGINRFEWTHKKPNGELFDCYITLEAVKFNGENCIRGTIEDISETLKLRRIVEEKTKELSLLSNIDPLTCLYNRRYFTEEMPNAISVMFRSKQVVSFFYLDVDHFKAYNDHYGHSQGDEALIAVAKSMSDTVKRTSDYCFRWGGEEFLVVLATQTEQDALAMANDIKDNIEALQIKHDSSPLGQHITVSIGVASIAPDSYNYSIDDMLRTADKQLYKAKEEGRNLVSQAFLVPPK